MPQVAIKAWLIFMLFSVGCRGSRVIHRLREHEKCPFKQGFPQSTCIITDDCRTLPLYLTRGDFTISQVDSCGFRDAYNELLCCPEQPPHASQTHLQWSPGVVLSRPFATTTAATSPEMNVSFNHIVSLTYLNEDLDNYIYRCTAAILADNLVVASSKCASFGSRSASRILLGVQDPSQAFSKYAEIELKTDSKHFKTELILYELVKSITTVQHRVAVSQSAICSPEDWKDSQKIQAVGYSQDANEENCALFVTDLQIVDYKACSELDPQYGKGSDVLTANIYSPHLCLTPLAGMRPAQGRGCRNCLTTSSSVLHLVRANGSRCVAGVATPTSNSCNDHDNRFTFTNFMSDEVSDFFNSQSLLNNITFRSVT